MPKLPLLSLCTLPLAAACGDAPITPTSITVSTVRAPEAIAFRDGLDGEWQTPTPTTTGTYKIDVHGPYVVSVVCKAGGDFLVTTQQIARTPEDERNLDMECAELPLLNSSVTGKMVQPGSIGLGGALDSSDTANWSFNFATTDGTFDLIAFSDARIAIRRDVAVTGTADVGTLDVDQQGVPLVPVALTVSNAAGAETTEAQVLIETPSTDSAYVHIGAPASAKIAPDELLSATTKQSVTMVAWGDHSARSVRRDFGAGDPTAFTLPAALEGVQFETSSGKLVATWSALPEHDKIRVAVYGSSADNNACDHELEVSQRFAAATGATSASLDTDIPGYLPAWRPDLGREYLREMLVERERTGERSSSDVFRLMNEQPEQRAARTRDLPRASLEKLRRAR
jgi:hypothetical protein